MPGAKGKIIRSKRGKKSVYLSDRLAVWKQGKEFHITKVYTKKSKQHIHIAVSKDDGLLYDVFEMLCKIGVRQRQI